jgi:hypothetical protein
MIYSTTSLDGDSETASVDVDVGDRVKVSLHCLAMHHIHTIYSNALDD